MRRLTIVCLAVAVAIAAAGLAAVTATGAGGAKVELRKTKLGRVLVDGKGRTLYLFEKDTTNKSNCTGECAAAWPPAKTTGKPVAGKGVRAKHLKAIKRADGSRQVSYYGHPLYRFSPDNNKPGSVKGQEVGGVWYVVGANGKAVE